MSQNQTPAWFYYTADNQRIGPFIASVLKQLALAGQILPDTVIENINGRREIAGKVQGLTFSTAPVPIVPTPLAPVPTPVPATQTPDSKNKLAAVLLALFFGGIGIHRYYVGDKMGGLNITLMVIYTLGLGSIVTSILALIDAIKLLTISDAEFNVLCTAYATDKSLTHVNVGTSVAKGIFRMAFVIIAIPISIPVTGILLEVLGYGTLPGTQLALIAVPIAIPTAFAFTFVIPILNRIKIGT